MRLWIRACLLAGMPVTLLGMLTAAGMLTVFDLPLRYYPSAAAIPLLTGCFAAGYSAGKHRRRGGIVCGSMPALLLSACWYAAACLLTGGLRSPLLLTVLLPAGISGGICGVNTKLPEPHRRPHRLIAARERAVLRPMLLHRPKRLAAPCTECAQKDSSLAMTRRSSEMSSDVSVPSRSQSALRMP